MSFIVDRAGLRVSTIFVGLARQEHNVYGELAMALPFIKARPLQEGTRAKLP